MDDLTTSQANPRGSCRAGTDRTSSLLTALLLLVFAVPAFSDDAVSNGRRLFEANCAECHGVRGQGNSEKYAQPLTGTMPLLELSSYISGSMPPDPRPKCSPDDAKQIAEFLLSGFYSKGQPAPRIELSHLTARQYRYAIADLMTSFRGSTGPWDDQRGLKGGYNTTAPNGEGKAVMERLDPEIHFNFEKSSPDPEKFNPRDFSMIWSGSIRAPLTGEYEFIIRSHNSVKLWIDNRVDPLIDAWVKSGDAIEYRGTVSLLAGHGYPVLLTFTKSGQGVMKSPEEKAKQEIAHADISLSWIPPGQSEQIVAKEFLSPHHFPESYFVRTPFPPDDRSTGFERGSSVSKEWERATTEAAIEIADYVVLRINDLSGGAQPGPDYESRLREFSRQFVHRAFRRPLSDDELSLYVDQQFEGVSDPELAVFKVVLLSLKSPRFLYHGIGDTKGDQYGKASRLAFALWDAPPDSTLLNAAAEGKLSSRDEVMQQADRMSKHPLARFKLREFFWQWMKLDQVREMEKSKEQFPGFDAATSRDLRMSLELLLNEVIASNDADFRRLLLTQSLYLNGPLSKLYGGGLPDTSPFQRVDVDLDHRAGVLTHPYLMSFLADQTTTSPIRRGVFVARGMLGRPLLPPPDAFSPLAPSLHPDLNTRERVMLQTQATSCQSCHAMINPLGFPFEQFDAIGRFRREEGGRPIDATGSYSTRTGIETEFHSVRDLANYLSQSDEAHAALVDKLFYFSVQQPIRAFGSDTHARIKTSFVESQFNLRKLMMEIGLTATMGPSERDSTNASN